MIKENKTQGLNVPGIKKITFLLRVPKVGNCLGYGLSVSAASVVELDVLSANTDPGSLKNNKDYKKSWQYYFYTLRLNSIVP